MKKEMKERLIQTKVHYKFFLLVQIGTTHKHSKVAAIKSFSPMCMLWMQLASINIFYYMS